ncbi:MAG: hypothetical protein PHU23_04605 [Dehalococcoidales bacterium]|nr:hypothetical protein [Dehalococcoidales bacterium]
MLSEKHNGQFRGLRGQTRHELLQIHRVTIFTLALNDYLKGRISAAVLRGRAKKMIEVGLPRM